MIEFQGVGKRFPGRHRTPGPVALRDVALTIPAGATWGVVGPNGAGKSTLFALLLGFLKPTSGTIRIAGADPRDYARRHGAAYLPERFRLPAGWTVRAALDALAALERIDSPAARAAEVSAQFGLEDSADKTIGTLSRGTLQRVGLAQALIAPRAVIVLDEPTEGLDPLWRLRFRELIVQRKSNAPAATGQAARTSSTPTSGATLLIASHDLAEVERLVDHVVLLDQGAVRDSFDITAPAGAPRRYRITLETPTEEIHDVLGEIEYADGKRTFIIRVRDARELSARLAALLSLGAVIESVQPADGLEERVRAALRTEEPW